jgi:GT2 family glycosyltransferase
MIGGVSIIIPTYNRAGSLERCLRALPLEVEVIVVDDGSSDGTSRVPSRVGHPKLIYVHQSNRGPAAARNFGVRTATGDILAFLDDDCVPQPEWMGALVGRLCHEPPSVGGVGGRVLPLSTGLISRYSTFHRILEPPDSCAYLVTANCAYRREAFESVGGFDESIRLPGGEDPDLALRVADRGYRFVYEPRAIVRHDYRESILDFARTFYRYGRGCSRVVAQ